MMYMFPEEPEPNHEGWMSEWRLGGIQFYIPSNPVWAPIIEIQVSRQYGG